MQNLISREGDESPASELSLLVILNKGLPTFFIEWTVITAKINKYYKWKQNLNQYTCFSFLPFLYFEKVYAP